MFLFPRPLLLLGDATRLNKKLQVCPKNLSRFMPCLTRLIEYSASPLVPICVSMNLA